MWFECLGGSGGGTPVSVLDFSRIIEEGWDGDSGNASYTFDKAYDECLIALTYTRETTLSDTSYTLTLANGSYQVLYDSDVVVGTTTQERVVYLKVTNVQVGDILAMHNYGDLKTADIAEIVEGDIERTVKFVEVETSSTGGSDASITLHYFESGSDLDDVTKIYSQVNGRNNAYDFHNLVKLYYSSGAYSWVLEALYDVVYNDEIYRTGETIATWRYDTSVDFDIYKVLPLKYGNALYDTGTFTSATTQHGIVNINIGFKPDLVMVFMKLSGGSVDTVSYWEQGLSYAQTSAIWCLQPAENVAYEVTLGRTSGETGIQQITNSGFAYMSNGGTQGCTCRYIAVKYNGSLPENDKVYLFKDGAWKNQDILEISTNGTSISNNKLKCSGTFSGIVVSDVSGLDSRDTTYNLYVKLSNSNVSSVQDGRCNPTTNLADIIQYGTDRISYNNDGLTANTDYEFILSAITQTSGVFLGNSSGDGGDMYITEIWLEEIQDNLLIRS